MFKQSAGILFVSLLLILPLGLLLATRPAVAAPVTDFTVDYDLEDCTFSNEGRNAFFSLHPGDRLRLEGEEDGELVAVQVRVLDKTRAFKLRSEDGKLLTIQTRIVEEREWHGGDLVEVSRNFFARCKETNDVYYFGENVDIYEDGEIVRHDGSWLAGKAGALPGITMPGSVLVGARYYQEIAPGVALDRAENKTLGLTMDLPAGRFDDCIEIIETTPLEPGHESRKVYCDGIGLVVDNAVELVEYDVDGADGEE